MCPTLHLVLNRTWKVECFIYLFACVSQVTGCLIVNLCNIDYLTANDPSLQTPLNDSQKADLYAELATAAEAGWDFSSRWFAGSTSTLGGLLSLNGRSMVGPDLNGILCELYISAFPPQKNDVRFKLTIYILQTRIIYRWQNFTVLPIRLQLTYT